MNPRRQVLVILCAAFLLFCWAAPSQGRPWSFAVIADTRSDPKIGRPGYSPDGVSPYLANLARHLAKEDVDLVLVPGDLAVGRGIAPAKHADIAVIRAQWSAWRAAMAPVLSKFPTYLVRGNHEVRLEDVEAETGLWRRMFPLPPGAADSATPGQQGLTFAFTHNGALFVGLDEYVDWDKTGRKPTLDLAFLDQALAKGAAHKFVFVHEPVWYGKMRDVGPTPESSPAAFARILNRHGVDLLFAGHVHLYQRLVRDGFCFEELIVGTGGAPLSAPTAPRDPAVRLLGEEASRFGYAIVTVDGDRVTTRMRLLDDPANPDSAMTEFDRAGWRGAR